MIGGLAEVVTPAGTVALNAPTERHVFAAALVAGGFPWVRCTLCDATLVRDGRAYVLHVGGWHRMIDAKAVTG